MARERGEESRTRREGACISSDREILLSQFRSKKKKRKKEEARKKKAEKKNSQALTSRDLDTGGLEVLRVARGARAPLAELLELVDL